MLNPVVRNITARCHSANTLVATVKALDINKLEKFCQDIHPICCLESRNNYYNRLL